MHHIGQFIANARPMLHPKTGLPVIAVNGKFQPVMLRANSMVLRYQDWLDIDRELLDVAKQRLVGVADLLSGGLTHQLGNIGITTSMFERQSDLTGAEITMAPETETERDRLGFDQVNVPVPFVHKDFPSRPRALAAKAEPTGRAWTWRPSRRQRARSRRPRRTCCSPAPRSSSARMRSTAT